MPRTKPASHAQLAANRANAARSTGPRSPEGKARSAQNSRKHGFTGSTFAVVRLEDLNEVQQLRDDAVAVYRPVNSQELFAVERIAIAQQCMLRASRLESGIFTLCLNETIDECDRPLTLLNKVLFNNDIEYSKPQNRNYCAAEGWNSIAKRSNAIGLFLRYQAQAERQYRRAIEDFDRLKALRHELPNEPNYDPITDPQPKQSKPTCPVSETGEIPPENPIPDPELPPSEAKPEPAAPETPASGPQLPLDRQSPAGKGLDSPKPVSANRGNPGRAPKSAGRLAS
jgi:hypothetical protein